MEPGTSWINSSDADTVSEFKTEAFQYNLPGSTAVYVECLVRVCLKADSSAECSACAEKRKRRALENEDQFERIRRASSDIGSEEIGQMAIIKSPVFFIINEGNDSNFLINHNFLENLYLKL